MRSNAPLNYKTMHVAIVAHAGIRRLNMSAITNTKITVHLDAKTKREFRVYCRKGGVSVSETLRGWIKVTLRAEKARRELLKCSN